jgi:hypothetical protein
MLVQAHVDFTLTFLPTFLFPYVSTTCLFHWIPPYSHDCFLCSPDLVACPFLTGIYSTYLVGLVYVMSFCIQHTGVLLRCTLSLFYF